MQKNQSSSTLLLNTLKTKIYHYRNEIKQNFIKTIITGLVLTIGIFSIAFISYTTFVKNKTIAQDKLYPANQILNPTQPHQPAEYKSINYERPASSDVYTKNSGGPASNFRLTVVESEEEESRLENQLRLIQATSNPAFLPTMWAHLGKINNEYGFRKNPFGGSSYEFHAGMDIDGEIGEVVIAPANGIVSEAGWQNGYGNMIEINHGNGLVTRYGHLSGIGVRVGDAVLRGQTIGLIGSTGRSTGPHLHFELRLNDKPINPRRFLPPEPAEIRALNK